MTFSFSDLAGIFWILAFPALCHIANTWTSYTKTTPITPRQTGQYIKKPIKPVKSNRGDYTNNIIKLELDELYKKEYAITHVPIKPHKTSQQVKPAIRAVPVIEIMQDAWKPAVTLASPWVSPCCILPMKPKPAPIKMQSKKPISAPMPAISKPAKFKKARKPRISTIIKPDAEELKLLRVNSGYKLRLTWIELAHLKTLAVKHGVDDWLSLVDSKLSYEENKAAFVQNFGALDSDEDMVQKYQNYQGMAQDYYT